MATLFLLGISILLISYVNYGSNKSSRESKKKLQDYLKREENANSTRLQPIDEMLYVTPTNFYLFSKTFEYTRENERIIKRQESCAKMLTEPMIYFEENLSNTDLKIKYGVGNLNKLILEEENFSIFTRNINLFAEELIKVGGNEFLNDAVNLLKYSVDFKSKISQTYILLANCYIKLEKTDKLNELKNQVLSGNLTDISKNKIIEYIEHNNK